VKKGIPEWLPRWKKRDWRTADRKPVKNADLWVRLEQEIARHEVHWHWVRGHSGHDGNERADALAGRLGDAQWPDGGGNCDRNASGQYEYRSK